MSFNTKTLDGAYDIEADTLTVNEKTDLKGTSLIEGQASFIKDIELDNPTNKITLSAKQATTDYNINLPPTIGTAGQILYTDGLGNSSWQTIGSPGGVSYIGITTPYPYLKVNGMGADSTTSSKTFTLSFDTTNPLPSIYGGTGINTVGTTGQVLTSNGSTLLWTTTVSSVSATSPLASSGGETPTISISSSTGSGAVVLESSPRFPSKIIIGGSGDIGINLNSGDSNSNSPNVLASYEGYQSDILYINTYSNSSGVPTVAFNGTNINGSLYVGPVDNSSRPLYTLDINGTLRTTGTTNLSALTASTALALDSSKNIVSITNTGTGNNVLSTSPTFSTSIKVSGSTSGTITLQPQADAGTYNWNYPITAGTSGQVLTSSGAGSSAMTWTTPTSGTVTSVSATVPSFLSISGSPITTSGTLAISYSGTPLPVLNGGTGTTTSTGTDNLVLSSAPTVSQLTSDYIILTSDQDSNSTQGALIATGGLSASNIFLRGSYHIPGTTSPESQIFINQILGGTISADTSFSPSKVATLYIPGAPTAGTNVSLTLKYSLLVDGNSAFSGDITIGGEASFDGETNLNGLTNFNGAISFGESSLHIPSAIITNLIMGPTLPSLIPPKPAVPTLIFGIDTTATKRWELGWSSTYVNYILKIGTLTNTVLDSNSLAFFTSSTIYDIFLGYNADDFKYELDIYSNVYKSTLDCRSLSFLTESIYDIFLGYNTEIGQYELDIYSGINRFSADNNSLKFYVEAVPVVSLGYNLTDLQYQLSINNGSAIMDLDSNSLNFKTGPAYSAFLGYDPTSLRWELDLYSTIYTSTATARGFSYLISNVKVIELEVSDLFTTEPELKFFREGVATMLLNSGGIKITAAGGFPPTLMSSEFSILADPIPFIEMAFASIVFNSGEAPLLTFNPTSIAAAAAFSIAANTDLNLQSLGVEGAGVVTIGAEGTVTADITINAVGPTSNVTISTEGAEGTIDLVCLGAAGAISLSSTLLTTIECGGLNITAGASTWEVGILNFTTANMSLECAGLEITSAANITLTAGSAINITSGGGLMTFGSGGGAIVMGTGGGDMSLLIGAGALNMTLVGGAFNITTGGGIFALETVAGDTTFTTTIGNIKMTCGTGNAEISSGTGAVFIYGPVGGVNIGESSRRCGHLITYTTNGITGASTANVEFYTNTSDSNTGPGNFIIDTTNAYTGLMDIKLKNTLNLKANGGNVISFSTEALSSAYTWKYPSTIGSSGQVLTSQGSSSALIWTTPTPGTVTSVSATVPSFLSISGSPITSSGTLALSYSGIALPVLNGGTGLTTSGTSGQLLTSVQSTNTATVYTYASSVGTLTVAGIYYIGQSVTLSGFTSTPTINGTQTVIAISSGKFSFATTAPSVSVLGTVSYISPAWAAPATSGTVTSVSATVPSFLSISGSPITSSGTLALSYSGTALPTANGGTGLTTVGTVNQVLTSNGTTLSWTTPTTGTVTSVSASAPLASSGGTTPSISISSSTGTGAVVLKSSPTLISPIIGDASGTSISLSGNASAASISISTSFISTNSNFGIYLGADRGSIASFLFTDSSITNTYITINGTYMLDVSGSLRITSTTTLSALTVSTALALDSSKNIISVTNTGTGNNVLATSPTFSTSTNISGSSSGTISLKPQAAAGTYNWNYPTTAGSSGQVLTSAGGSSSAMTWTTPTTGTVTSVSATSPLASSGGANPTISISSSTGSGAVVLESSPRFPSKIIIGGSGDIGINLNSGGSNSNSPNVLASYQGYQSDILYINTYSNSIGVPTVAFNGTNINGSLYVGPVDNSSRPLYTLDINGTLRITGTTSLSALTASTALALDSSKNIISITNTGTGNNVLATSPTITTPVINTINTSADFIVNGSASSSIMLLANATNTGIRISAFTTYLELNTTYANGFFLGANSSTITSALQGAISLYGSLTISTAAGGSGNLVVPGTLAVTGATTLSSTLTVNSTLLSYNSGSFSAASPVTIPIDTSRHVANIKIVYVCSNSTISITLRGNTAANGSGSNIAVSEPEEYVLKFSGGTSTTSTGIICTNNESNSITNYCNIRMICQNTNRNQYLTDTVYCWATVGASRLSGSGFIGNTMASIQLVPSAGTLTGTWYIDYV